MGIKEKLHSGMPLLEIILTIGIFSVISIFILQLYLAADTYQKKAEDLSRGTIEVQSVIETLKGMNLKDGMNYLGFSNVNGQGEYVKYYDEAWKPVDIENKYSINVRIISDKMKNGIYSTIEVLVKYGEHEIIRLEGTDYKRGENLL